MKKLLGLLVCITLLLSCKNKESEKSDSTVKTDYQEIIKDDYVLNKPLKNIKGVLILFGGYPEDANAIKQEFKILEQAKAENVAVLYMNYNRKLWLEQKERVLLSEQIQNIIKTEQLPTENIYVGGFSSGGNVALLISNFMTQEHASIFPKGVFIGDSPVDLAALYHIAKKCEARNISNSTTEECKWLVQTLGQAFGTPESDLANYEAYSVFTSTTNNIQNIKNLKHTKIRLYTEPDSLWWKTHNMSTYEDMNAYSIKKLSDVLQQNNFEHVEYITTVNKGYRANGDRHPHSWSIIDGTSLINWMLNK